MYTLRKELFISKPLKVVFAFFERPENLERITPPWLGFKILTPSPIAMKVGAKIQYRIRLLGLPAGWTSLISAYDPPRRFVDEQISGPYKVWKHTHEFIEKGGGTLVIDHVEYDLHFGILGSLAHWIYVKRSLDEIFAYRTKVITALLAS